MSIQSPLEDDDRRKEMKLQAQRMAWLARIIVDIGKRLGIVDGHMSLTGPEVLVLGENVDEAVARLQAINSELLAACKEGFIYACAVNNDQELIDMLDKAIHKAEQGASP